MPHDQDMELRLGHSRTRLGLTAQEVGQKTVPTPEFPAQTSPSDASEGASGQIYLACFRVYTLFGVDGQYRPQRQLLEGSIAENDTRTWKLARHYDKLLRDHEKVLACDCIFTIRHWGSAMPWVGPCWPPPRIKSSLPKHSFRCRPWPPMLPRNLILLNLSLETFIPNFNVVRAISP